MIFIWRAKKIYFKKFFRSSFQTLCSQPTLAFLTKILKFFFKLLPPCFFYSHLRSIQRVNCAISRKKIADFHYIGKMHLPTFLDFLQNRDPGQLPVSGSGLNWVMDTKLLFSDIPCRIKQRFRKYKNCYCNWPIAVVGILQSRRWL